MSTKPRSGSKSRSHIPHLAASSPCSLEPWTMLWRRMFATSIAWLICIPVSTAGRRFFSKFWRASWRAARRTGRSSITDVSMNETDASVAGVFVKRTVEDNPGRPEELPIGTLSGSSSGGGHSEKRMWMSQRSIDVSVCRNKSRSTGLQIVAADDRHGQGYGMKL
jgi:hypothetical protein